MSGRLYVPSRELVTSEAVGRVGIRGTWRGRIYRRNGELVELSGANVFLNSGLDLIGSRFDTLGMAALTDPAYRFENWLPHLALGSDATPPAPTDAASVLSYVGHGTIDQAPVVTQSLDLGPPEERVLETTLHFVYEAAGGESVAEMGICHWSEGRYLTRSLVYDLAGNPVTVDLGAGDQFLVDYFITMRSPLYVEFEDVPLPEGGAATWQVVVGLSLMRQLLRYGFDANLTQAYPNSHLYPWVTAWNDPTYTAASNYYQRPMAFFNLAWEGVWDWSKNDNPIGAGGTAGGSFPLQTQRAWERMPYVPGSYQLTFAVSVLRNLSSFPSFTNKGFMASAYAEGMPAFISALAFAALPATNTYLRTVFTVSWGNA